MAAAIGSRLPIQDAIGNMIVDVGGGTTEIAVISLGGVVAWRSIKIAGNELDNNIIQFARDHFNLLMGEKTAESIKIKIGSALDDGEDRETTMRGRDLMSGLPKEVVITGEQVREAIARSLRTIVDNIKDTIENTPPEIVSDIYERGMMLAGGGALLKGLDRLINLETSVPVHIVDDPLTCVVRGAGIVLDDLEKLREVLVLSTKDEFITK
jgi:rod shape-determining protein MreB